MVAVDEGAAAEVAAACVPAAGSRPRGHVARSQHGARPRARPSPGGGARPGADKWRVPDPVAVLGRRSAARRPGEGIAQGGARPGGGLPGQGAGAGQRTHATSCRFASTVRRSGQVVKR